MKNSKKKKDETNIYTTQYLIHSTKSTIQYVIYRCQTNNL